MKKPQQNRQKYRKIIKNVEKQEKNYKKCEKIIKNVEKLEKTDNNILKL